jgi:hypothetical protein
LLTGHAARHLDPDYPTGFEEKRDELGGRRRPWLSCHAHRVLPGTAEAVVEMKRMAGQKSPP